VKAPVAATPVAAPWGETLSRRRIVFVHAECRERRQFEERCAGVEQALDALANRKLSLLAVALEVLRAGAFLRPHDAAPQFGDEFLHSIAIGAKDRIGRIDVSIERDHGASEARPTNRRNRF
jgi:hypothetical protein